jgi:uncharacterized protein (DUF1330 family)
MKAYAIVQETVNDQKMFDEYRKDVVATLAEYGGRFVVRGGHLTVVEGEWPHKRTVVLEFPSREAAEGWYQSPAYQKLLPLRLKSCNGNFIIVDGVD